MNNTYFDLNGKTALITGSGQGIGYTIAKGLGRSGARIVLNDVIQERLDTAVDKLKKDGIDVYGSLFSVTERKQIEKAVGHIESEIGSIDILVNNAGIQRRAPLESFDESDWRDVLDINLTGVFLTTQCVARNMIQRRSGKIINICSLQSELGRKTIAPYAASKGGVKMLTRAMAVEWGEYNIQVNGIGPGYFLTEMTRKLADDVKFDTWLRARTPANRWGDPDELTGTAIFLASAASDFITGQIIYVDGGILAAI